MLHNFSQKLDELIQSNPHRSTALYVVPNVEAETNAALLLGAYMVMRLDISPEDAMKRLAVLNIAPFPNGPLPAKCQIISNRLLDEIHRKVEANTKTSHCKQQLLRVIDCLEVMLLAKNLRWIDLSSQLSNENQQDVPAHMFDAEEYEFLSNPLNADLNEVS